MWARSLWYIYPFFKHVSFGVIGMKHYHLLKQHMRVEPIDEGAFPSIQIVSHPLIFSQPYFYMMQRFEKKIARNLPQIHGLVGVDVADSDHITRYAVRLTKYATAMIVPSTFSKRSYVNSKVKRPVHVVPHGVDREWLDTPPQKSAVFSPLAHLKETRNLKLILCYMVHSPHRKGLDLLLRFYNKLLKERSDILLVLKTVHRVRYSSKPIKNLKDMAEIPVDKKTLKGWLTEQQKMELYDLCDIFFLSSRGGAFEHPALEALARGEVVLGAKGGCYSDDTFAFTENGLKRWNDCKVGEKVLTVNVETRGLEWKPILNIVAYDYSGEMIHFYGRHFDLLVTPDHRMLIKKEESACRFERAKALAGRKEFYLFTQAKFNGSKEFAKHIVTLLETFQKELRWNAKKLDLKEINVGDICELIGWYLAEGYLQQQRCKTKNIINICEPKNGKYRKKVENLLRRLGLSQTGDEDRLRFHSIALAKLLSLFGEGASRKEIPRWVLDLDKDLLQRLLDGIIAGDGVKRKNNIRLWTVSEKLAICVVELLIKLGYSVILTKEKGKIRTFFDGHIAHGKDYYYIRASKSKGYVNKYRNIKMERYNGKVWCFVVKDNHNFLVYRNGKFTFCGNSWEDYLPDWALIPSTKSSKVLAKNPIHNGYGVKLNVDKSVDKAVEILNDLDRYKVRVREHVNTHIKEKFLWENIGLQLRDVALKYMGKA